MPHFFVDGLPGLDTRALHPDSFGPLVLRTRGSSLFLGCSRFLCRVSARSGEVVWLIERESATMRISKSTWTLPRRIHTPLWPAGLDLWYNEADDVIVALLPTEDGGALVSARKAGTGHRLWEHFIPIPAADLAAGRETLNLKPTVGGASSLTKVPGHELLVGTFGTSRTNFLAGELLVLYMHDRTHRFERQYGSLLGVWEHGAVCLAGKKWERLANEQMTHVVHGRINGKTIELDSELAVPDGQQVEVFVRAVEPYKGWGEGIRRSAGAAADIDDFDEVFAQIERERKAATFRAADE